MDPLQRLGYDLFLAVWRVIANIFFREIRPRGAYNIPLSGPVIFVVAPHKNQFPDGILFMSEVFKQSGRRAQCLVAATSMKRKFIGTFAAIQGSIPVVRAQDSAESGTGLITISDDDPCLVMGQGTNFSAQLAPKKQLRLPKSLKSPAAEVVEVISDTKVRVRREFANDNGKSTDAIREAVSQARKSDGDDTAWGLEFSILPHVDQQQMYGEVYKTLNKGGAIGIFPEGGSHDRTDLLPLKAGASVMALGAMAANDQLHVKIVPVGLSYFHAHRFRSRAVVEFGPAIDVPDDLLALYKCGSEKKREAGGKLMDMIYDGVKAVTLRAPDYDTLMVIQAARRLYQTPGQHLTLGQVVEMNKRFMEAYEHFKDEPRVAVLSERVRQYNRRLRDLGLRDHQVPRARKVAWKTLGLTIYRVGLLLVWSGFALPGVILNGPIFILATTISRRKAKEALAASTVKVAGRDVLATWKILVSLGVTPVLYVFYAAVAAALAARAGASFELRVAAAVGTLISLPCIAYAALKFGEAGLDVFKSLRPLILSLLPGGQRQLNRIKKMRMDLSNELSDVVNEFGPKLYGDFDQWKILHPSASVPPSGNGEGSGFWRRKTNIGAVDAQGSLLTHPMTWMDERLFGWTASPEIGTHEVGESSDDAGDYDDIFAGSKTSSSGHVTPRKSYADLQQLRQTPLMESKPLES